MESIEEYFKNKVINEEIIDRTLLRNLYTIDNMFVYACRILGNLEFVNLLIKKGANNWGDGLSNACRGGYLSIAKLMIEKGEDNYRHNYVLIDSCFGGNLELVNLLLEKWSYSRYCFDDGLLIALKRGHVEIAKLMIKKGAHNFNNWYDRNNEIKILKYYKIFISMGGYFEKSYYNKLISSQDPLYFLITNKVDFDIPEHMIKELGVFLN